MLPFKLIYSDAYYLPIGEHVFPAQKYRLIHEHLLRTGAAAHDDFLTPEPARDADVLLVHTPAWVTKLRSGTLSAREELMMEVPYSPELVRAFWLAAGGSILAAQCALRDRVGISIGGGFHHAFADHGEGFCVINDIAIAIRKLQREGSIARAMTVDCDVHQGNGTAAIFAANNGATGWSFGGMGARDFSGFDSDVFTISLHQENNYPAFKPPSSIDVNLADGVGDAEYLAQLDKALSAGLHRSDPQLLCYVAGADPYREDQLGGLSLTIDGLKKRDELVYRAAKARGIPVMVTLAGGYAQQVEDTVTIHCNTVIAAKEVYSS
ncbi:MAG TPA: histone deacetylase [Terriglobales bacterium]|nr:histone deacetylase [Terriglobales bacterium]